MFIKQGDKDSFSLLFRVRLSLFKMVDSSQVIAKDLLGVAFKGHFNPV